MQGYGLTLEGTDTVFYEKLRLIVQEDEVIYIADVGEGPVQFLLKDKQEDKWQFENPENEFPKRIIYVRSDTTMTVYTEADQISIPFTFIKSK